MRVGEEASILSIEPSSTLITPKASGHPGIGGGEGEVAMKKLCFGLLLASALLFAQAASADPCGLCQAYYPCSWPCEICTGLWTFDGYCMGEVIEATCGDVGQCTRSRSVWHFEPVANQSVQSKACAQPLPFLTPAPPTR